MRWTTILWPGLPQLWLRGEWSALGLAIGFSALVNLVLLATWGWTDLLEPAVLLAAWSSVVLFWLVSLFGGVAQMRRQCGVSSPETDGDLFRAAQGEYLRGNWFEAELALKGLLERDPTDVDAQLLLASLLYRIGQADEAREGLRRLSTMEGAGKWQFEMSRLRRFLDQSVELTAQNVQLQENTEVGLPSAA